MNYFLKRIAVWALVGLGLAAANKAQAADLDYGKLGQPIHLAVGYQPYFSEIMDRGRRERPSAMEEVPAGRLDRSNLASACRDRSSSTPCSQAKRASAISATCPPSSKQPSATSPICKSSPMSALSHDQCNVFFVRKDAPKFASQPKRP